MEMQDVLHSTVLAVQNIPDNWKKFASSTTACNHSADGNLKLLRECLCALKYSRMKVKACSTDSLHAVQRIEGGWAPG